MKNKPKPKFKKHCVHCQERIWQDRYMIVCERDDHCQVKGMPQNVLWHPMSCIVRIQERMDDHSWPPIKHWLETAYPFFEWFEISAIIEKYSIDSSKRKKCIRLDLDLLIKFEKFLITQKFLEKDPHFDSSAFWTSKESILFYKKKEK